MQDRKLVFIIGAPRSGTSWLQLILSQSPLISTVQETHLFSLYLKSQLVSWRYFRDQKRGRGLASLLSEEEFFAWIGDLAWLCMDRIAANRPDAKIVVEKTPNHGHCGPEIMRVFPDAFFIHALRDPRSVAASLRAAAASWGAHWAPSGLKGACAVYKNDVTQAQAIQQLTPRYREVFYERLHADGPAELMRLFDWLGEPIVHAEAEKYLAACAIEKLRLGPADAPWDLKTEPDAFFRRGEIDSWRDDLTPSDIAIVERLTKKHMKRLGYEPVSARRARMIASLRLRAYRTANALAQATRSLADRVKP